MRQPALFTEAEVASIGADFERARTLPPRAFTSPAFFSAEVEQIFFAGWMSVAFSQALRSPGDVLPVNALGAPLLLVRQPGGRLLAFHNISPYDGAEIRIDPLRAASEIETPYHGWVYSLDGKLVRAPFFDGTPAAGRDALRGEHIDLTRLPVDEWGGLVFANVSGRARKTFAEYIAPLAEHFADVDLATLRIDRDENGEIQTDRGVVQANWKTSFENACINVYHEKFTHAIYKASPDIPRVTAKGGKTYEEVNNRGLFGLSFRVAQVSRTYAELPVPRIMTKLGVPVQRESTVSLYPNTYYSLIDGHVHATILMPRGPDSAELIGASHYVGSAASDPEILKLRLAVLDAWKTVRSEDGRVMESVQRARRSPVATQNYFARFWDRMHHDFTRRVVADLLEAQ